MPVMMRWIAARLRIAVAQKFPEARVSCVGGYIFLRFICPALLAPKARGVTQTDPPPKTQRALLLIGKVLQNLANNVQFKKEVHMLPLNSFLTEQQTNLESFFDRMVDIDLSSIGFVPHFFPFCLQFYLQFCCVLWVIQSKRKGKKERKGEERRKTHFLYLFL